MQKDTIDYYTFSHGGKSNIPKLACSRSFCYNQTNKREGEHHK